MNWYILCGLALMVASIETDKRTRSSSQIWPLLALIGFCVFCYGIADSVFLLSGQPK